MNSFLPIPFISSFLVIFLSTSLFTTLASSLLLLATPQSDFSELNSFSSPNNNIDFLLLPKQQQQQQQEEEEEEEQQQPFPLGATPNSNALLPLVADDDQPTPASRNHRCSSLLLNPRSTDDSPSSTTSTTEPNMCPINAGGAPFPAPDWDQEWKDYLHKYPPEEGVLVLPEEGAAENQGYKDESVGTGCPDPFHQDHLCCAGPAGKTGVFSIRPDDISFIQHCAVCM